MGELKNIAVILSAGSGLRFGSDLPKQFLKLEDRPVIAHSITAFEESPHIDEIYVVSQYDYMEEIRKIAGIYKYKKLKGLIEGGKTRFDSTFLALNTLRNYSKDSRVLFHDAVRPLIDQRTIEECVLALDNYQALSVVVDSLDTLVLIKDNLIEDIPDRSLIKREQTPQAFRLGTIIKAYDKALESADLNFTCDCGVLRHSLPDIEIAIVKGSEKNLKITYPLDLLIAEILLKD